jgi:signal transduction histidine kinase
MTAPSPGPRRARLAWKLVLAVAAIAVVLAAFLLGYVGPRSTDAFVRRSHAVLRQTTDLLERLAHDHTEISRQVLVDVIAQTAETRARMLADLPYSLYGGDIDRIRAALDKADADRAEQMRANSHVLAREMKTRASERINGHLSELTVEQEHLTAEFASDLRRSHLALCGFVLTVLLAVLGLGLYAFVVRPVRILRQATHRVASGDLDVDVATRARDEIGDLAADFTGMVRQLRDSRGELTRLNGQLEAEVARKTERLERTVQELRSTHGQLAQAEKMASIGTLASGIAHEFNNLIGGIRGCAKELRAGETECSRIETLDVMLRATDRATNVTRQLLRFARRSMENIADVDVAQVLGEALGLVDPEARRRGIAVTRAFGTGLVLRGDPDGLHQVFLNLFTNALRAMPQGGELAVTAACDGNEVVVTVADNGTGIAPEHLERVFEPFFTSMMGRSDGQEPGTGLGLSVSYGIVTAHGGRMTVASKPGAGSTFTVRLPSGVASAQGGRA